MNRESNGVIHGASEGGVAGKYAADEAIAPKMSAFDRYLEELEQVPA